MQPKPWAAVHRSMCQRGTIIAVIFGAAALVVVGRAYHLQIVKGPEYSDAAKRQAVTSKEIKAKRGVIKDRNGVDLAISVDVDSVFAEPQRIQDPAAAAKRLAPLLKQDRARLEGRLRSDRHFVYLARRVDPDTARAVREAGLKGVGIRPEPKRFYSNRELAAHVLGFTNHRGEGKAGVERQFEEWLRGTTLEVEGLRDALGQKVLKDGVVPQAALEGDDLILTIDRRIQHAAEVELERAVTENEGRAGTAVVLDPNTGEVLALASYPSFNPNNLSGSETGARLNRAISAVFEPGSTMKMVTIAGALEDELFEPTSKVDCEEGRWRFGGRTIRDGSHHYGLLEIGDVLKVSSNICAAKVGIQLGRSRLHHWLTSFGFGAPTGIELPGELRGLIRPPERWRDITLANVAFGQGLSVTHLQVAQAASVIASGGVLHPPRLVRGVVDKSGRPEEIEHPEATRVLSEKTASIVGKMLTRVTSDGGTAESARIPGFTVAGKTGTAQKIDPVTKAYSRSLYVASFVGFVPAEAPRVVVAVMVDEPQKSIYGGVVAAPAFSRIATAALSALEVHPADRGSREAFLQTVKALETQKKPQKKPTPAPRRPGLNGQLSARALALLGEAQLPVETEDPPPAWEAGVAHADPEDTQSSPKAGSDRMPNFADLPLREVLSRSAALRCDLLLSGTGRVASQSPPPGTQLEEGARCEVRLAPRS